MSTKDLKLKIDVVLELDAWDIKHNKSVFTTLSEPESKISYPHAETLINLFISIQDNNKLSSYFVEYLKEISLESDTTLSIIFYTLLKLGFIDAAIEVLQTSTTSIKYPTSCIFMLLKEMIRINVLNVLSLQQAYNLTEAVGYIDAVHPIPAIKKLVNSIKDVVLTSLHSSTYNIVVGEIKGINIEINRDKEVVKEHITYLGFDSKYSKLLDSIDNYLNSEDVTLHSGMIGNLRSFFQDLLTDMAKKIAAINKEEIPRYPEIDKISEIGRVRRYLVSQLEMSANDDKLIDSFINILHTEGGHSFVSNKEYFRLSRNIGVEIALFVLSKYRYKYKE